MAIDSRFSFVRREWVEVSRIYPEDGFLFLADDPEIWIPSDPVDRLSSVRCLELHIWCYKGKAIGDSIGDLTDLTCLCIAGGSCLKFPPNTISRLYKLQQLKLCSCDLQELPANLGDLESLTSLFLDGVDKLKFLPDSVAKLSKLTCLSFTDSVLLEE